MKFADTDRDRTAKRYHKAAAGLYNGIPFAGGAVGNPLPQAAAAATAPLALYQQIAALHSLLNSAGGGAGPSAAASGTDQGRVLVHVTQVCGRACATCSCSSQILVSRE